MYTVTANTVYATAVHVRSIGGITLYVQSPREYLKRK